MNCGKCGQPATKMGYVKYEPGLPPQENHYWYCTACRLTEDGGRWVSAYDELKRYDDQYRREQN